MGLMSPDERLDRPENGQYRCNHDDCPKSPDHEPDQDLDGQRRYHNQNQARRGFPEYRGARTRSLNLGIHETSVPRRDRGLECLSRRAA